MNKIHHEQSDNPVSQDQAHSPYQEKILDDNPIAGLELYRSTIQPSEHSHRQQPGLLSPSDESSHTSDNLTTKDSTPPVPPSRHSRGPRFWLIASLSVFAIMATVAAIVTGVLLAKSRSTHNQRDSILHSTSPSDSPLCSNNTLPPPSLQTPKSSCPTLPQNYTVAANPASAINASTDFTLRCGHDYKLPLIMGIRTYTFENCIHACASQRTNVYANGADGSLACTAVAYKPDSGQMLTCWLKSDMGNTGAGEIESQGVDGAVVV